MDIKNNTLTPSIQSGHDDCGNLYDSCQEKGYKDSLSVSLSAIGKNDHAVMMVIIKMLLANNCKHFYKSENVPFFLFCHSRLNTSLSTETKYI